MRKTLIWGLLLILLAACQPKTVVVPSGQPVPEQRWDQPIYITTTPGPTYRGDWTYKDAALYTGVIRFRDNVGGTKVVCYYARNVGLSCVALCGEGQ